MHFHPLLRPRTGPWRTPLKMTHLTKSDRAFSSLVVAPNGAMENSVEEQAPIRAATVTERWSRDHRSLTVAARIGGSVLHRVWWAEGPWDSLTIAVPICGAACRHASGARRMQRLAQRTVSHRVAAHHVARPVGAHCASARVRSPGIPACCRGFGRPRSRPPPPHLRSSSARDWRDAIA
jgi:hypothetical protein